MRKRQIFHKMISCLMATVMVVSIAFPSNMQAASQKAPKLNVKKVTLQVGKKAKLKVKGVTKAQVKKLTFTSNKKKVAKVSAKGKVTAVSTGKARITC